MCVKPFVDSRNERVKAENKKLFVFCNGLKKNRVGR